MRINDHIAKHKENTSQSITRFSNYILRIKEKHPRSLADFVKVCENSVHKTWMQEWKN